VEALDGRKWKILLKKWKIPLENKRPYSKTDNLLKGEIPQKFCSVNNIRLTL
jgi:hypothetical protein